MDWGKRGNWLNHRHSRHFLRCCVERRVCSDAHDDVAMTYTDTDSDTDHNTRTFVLIMLKRDIELAVWHVVITMIWQSLVDFSGTIYFIVFTGHQAAIIARVHRRALLASKFSALALSARPSSHLCIRLCCRTIGVKPASTNKLRDWQKAILLTRLWENMLGWRSFASLVRRTMIKISENQKNLLAHWYYIRSPHLSNYHHPPVIKHSWPMLVHAGPNHER